MQRISEEHRQFEIIREILSKIIKNQNSNTNNLTEFENNTLIYVYALEQINTRYGLNYTNIRSLSDELNEQTKLFQFWSNSYINSQFKTDNFNKIEFNDILAYGFISGFPITTLIKKIIFISKSNHLSAFLQIYGLNYNTQEEGLEIIKALNKLEIFSAIFNTRSCKVKIDDIVIRNDIVHIIGYRTLNKSLNIKLTINDELYNSDLFSQKKLF